MLLGFVLARASRHYLAFSVGILISLIEGSLVGAASMGLSIVAYVLLHNIYTIRQLDWISQTAVIFLLLGISVALQRVVLAAVGVPSDGLGYLIAVVISALLWRPLTCSSTRTFPDWATAMRLILASASPRRRELLRMLVPAFECEAADIDEAMLGDELPADYVCRMSSEKAARVWVPVVWCWCRYNGCVSWTRVAQTRFFCRCRGNVALIERSNA